MKFRPVSQYFPPIDAVIGQVEDVSYRSQQVNEYLEVLWHPHETYLVGVKVLHAKRVHQGLSGWPISQPLSLLVMVCAALMESRDHVVVSPEVASALTDFLQKHKDTTDIQPEERNRIDASEQP